MNNYAQDAAVLWHESGVDKLKLLSIGEIGVLMGPLGIGKSQLTLQLALAADKAMHSNAYQGTDCAISVRARNVVIVNYDEPKPFGIGTNLNVFDFREKGPSCRKGPLYTTKDGVAGQNRAPWDFLWDQCEYVKPALVVIDSVCCAAVDGASTSDMVTSVFMTGLANKAVAVGCAVLVVAHGTGSATWHGRADNVLHMAQEDSGERVLHCIKTGRRVPLTGFEKWATGW